jgi:gamma-glutamylputrescine oxidase
LGQYAEMPLNGHPSVLAASGQHVQSYYAATAAKPVVTAPLEGSASSEVCIVGGGFTGLSAALHLARRGIRVHLLEQSLLGWGASGRNGGQAHVGMRRSQHWLEARFGKDTAREYWALGLRARDHLDWLLDTYQIECDFRPGMLHADHRERYVQDSRRYVEHLNQEYGYRSLRAVSTEEMRSLVATKSYFGGSLDERSGHLHPLNYALGIARAANQHGAVLHENSEVLRISRTQSGFAVSTAQGKVLANQVLLATNGYHRGLSADVSAHVMPINNFIAVTEPLSDPESLIRRGYGVADSRFVVYYFRLTPDGRLLFGGGENYTYRFPSDIAGYVRRHILRVFPQLASVRIDYAWGGTLAITSNRMPYLRELEPGLYNASGYSGKGVVMAPYAGRIVADAIAGKREEFDLMSRIPAPRFPGGVALRTPTLVAGMSFAALRDRL